MDKASDLIKVAKKYSTHTGCSLEQASYQIFKDQRRLKSIADGRTDPRLSSYEAAMNWFHAHWPEDEIWPEGVERPTEMSELVA